MKLGILEADKLNAETEAAHGSYGEMFERLLGPAAPAGRNALSFRSYKAIDAELPKNTDECDAYLITGSKFSVYDDQPWIKQLQDYVVTLAERKKKLIGICFGHQIIAQALGGEVRKHEGGWGIGRKSTGVLQIKTWMQPATDSFALLVSHQDQVTRLPPGAELIAGDDFCRHSGYQIGEHILAFQGHPEFTPAYLESRLYARRAKLGERLYQKALASLARATDHQLIARWIVNFLDRPGD